jgi:hypothetical protein
VLGLAVAAAGLRGIHAFATEPFFRQLTFDYRVLTFAIALSFIAPDQMDLLFTEPLGRMMVGCAIVMQTIGFFWIRQVIKIEV